MTAPVDILKEARSLISRPDLWTQGRFHNDDLTQFCASGALKFVYRRQMTTGYDVDYYRARVLLKKACTRLFGLEIVLVNDRLGHGPIMLAFDVAIGDPAPDAPKEPVPETSLEKASP